MSEDEEDQTLVISGEEAAAAAPTTSPRTNAPAARLICLDPSQAENLTDGFEVELADGVEKVVGRDPNCGLFLDSRKLSRNHARVFAGMGTWGVEDLDSTNGVYVNGQRVNSAWLRHGDEVRFAFSPFRYEVEKPELGAGPAAAAPMAGDVDDDEDAEDKTMFIGSVGAGEAVINAAETAEPADEPVAAPVRPQTSKQIKAKRSGGRRVLRWFLVLLILGVIGAAGVLYYPKYQRQRDIDAAIAEADAVVGSIIQTARGRTSAQVYSADYEADLVKLSEAELKVGRVAEANKANAGLANLRARMTFLRFEREFAGHVDGGQLKDAVALAQSTRTQLSGVADGLPAGLQEKDRETVRTAQELLELAFILVKFRDFAARFPDVSEDGAKPNAEQLAEMEEAKRQFTHYRRSYNSALSINYLVYRTLVVDVDEKNIPLVNDWKQFLSADQ